ncbi:MAG: alpha/beta hydrolase [Bacteroidota bacterium]
MLTEDTMKMDEKHVTSARGKTHYWIKINDANPSTDCVVFSHGLTADHTLFDKQVDFWSTAYTIITWDMPLHGESRPYENFTLGHAAAELKVILAAEKIEKCILIGQSAGGYVSQVFIREYPKMVSAFIGIGTTPLGAKNYKKSDLFWLKHFSTIARWYPYRWYCRAAAKVATHTEAARQNFYQALVKLGKAAMLKATKQVYSDFLRIQTDTEFSCPVLLVIGEHDTTGLVRAYNQQWAERSGFPLVEITEAAHNANFDNSEDFNRVVKDFLDSHLTLA